MEQKGNNGQISLVNKRHYQIQFKRTLTEKVTKNIKKSIKKSRKLISIHIENHFQKFENSLFIVLEKKYTSLL